MPPLALPLLLLPALTLVGCGPREPAFYPGVSERPPEESEPSSTTTALPGDVWERFLELPSYQPMGRRFASGGHLGGRYDGQIFANALATEKFAALVHKTRMPEGAVLVEIHGAEGRERGPIFAMVKREAGYFPEGSDWEYVVLGPEGKVQASGKLPLCARCHAEGTGDALFPVPKAAR